MLALAVQLDDSHPEIASTMDACEAVLCQRSQMGDAKRNRGRLRAQLLTDIRCPFGCVDESGAPAPFTWVHAQFYCQQEEQNALRGEWCRACTDVQGKLPSNNAKGGYRSW